ncbi:MAG: endonuclease/exonuclease/phosphatase family protein [Prevotellaceae bacterium]|jgi:endonuclease/exonuclease/phosphatase family metal-dependent hydrolase|nr:endonuclease/exonuclease/phosphatase family protein [Prevotellaceae bacterium]
MKHIITWVLKVGIVPAAVGLAMSYFARYVHPAGTWFFAFFGLLFPQLVALNVLLAVSWLVVKRKVLWWHAAVILPAFFFLPAYVQWQRGDHQPVQRGEIKIITYNVHLFGVNTATRTLETLPDIAAFIGKEAPDIVCLQEAAVFDTAGIRRLFPDYPHIYYRSRRLFGKAWFTTATLSRHPVRGKGVIVFPNSGNTCIYTDISIDGQIVRVYNNHLESTRLDLAMSFSRLKEDRVRNEEIKRVTVRLRDAFKKRAAQVDTVAAHIAASPYPVLVCGDFNDLPMSYTYRKMKGSRHDAFMDAGAGMPSSFRSMLPAFRIDYIFNDDYFEAKQFYIPEIRYSDHYPVVAVFARHSTAQPMDNEK